MYEFQDRVRYSETDEDGDMKVVAMVNYLQDCSTFHSTDVGLTVERLRALQRAWLLSYWDIYIERLPRLCERLVIGTSPPQLQGGDCPPELLDPGRGGKGYPAGGQPVVFL